MSAWVDKRGRVWGTPAERLAFGTKKTATCWLWQGGKTKQGYGRIKVGRAMAYAHRLAWRLKHGRVPKLLMHMCNTPNCVRLHSKHVVRGTAKANSQHMAACGRQVYQVRPWLAHGQHGTRKTTRTEVSEIKRSLRAGRKRTDIARQIGLSYDVVAKIDRGESWKGIA